MNKIEYYYYLRPTTDNAERMIREEEDRAEKTWMCEGCRTPKEGIEGVNITIKDKVRKNGPVMNFTAEGSLGIARRDFLTLFGEKNLEECLYLGSITDPAGLQKDWVTYHGKHRLIVRGTQHVSYHPCRKSCGRNTYFATGKFHLYPRPDPAIPILYENRRLIIRPDIFEPIEAQVREMGKRNVYIKKIPVFDTPQDGIEEELVP